MEGPGGIPISPLRALQTTRNPPETAGRCPDPLGCGPDPWGRCKLVNISSLVRPVPSPTKSATAYATRNESCWRAACAPASCFLMGRRLGRESLIHKACAFSSKNEVFLMNLIHTIQFSGSHNPRYCTAGSSGSRPRCARRPRSARRQSRQSRRFPRRCPENSA